MLFSHPLSPNADPDQRGSKINTDSQCCGSGSGIGENQDTDPWRTSRIIFRELRQQFFGLRILKFFDADPDPGSGIFFTLDLRDGKICIRDNHPGSATLRIHIRKLGQTIHHLLILFRHANEQGARVFSALVISLVGWWPMGPLWIPGPLCLSFSLLLL